MEYSIAGYMERKRTRNINSTNRKDDITSVTESEPCSKKNSITANPFISATRGKSDFTLIFHNIFIYLKKAQEQITDNLSNVSM